MTLTITSIRLLLLVAILCGAVSAISQEAPANDDFANAIEFIGLPVSVSGTNVGSTMEANEPIQGIGKTVWWRWVAPVDVVVGMKNEGGTPGTIVTVWKGTSFTNLNFMTEFRTSLPGWFAFAAERGQMYYFCGDTRRGWSEGKIAFRLVGPPANDNFSSAIELAGSVVRMIGDVAWGSSESDPGIWWRWTPSFTGDAKLEDTGSAEGLRLDVFTGTSVDALERIATGTSNTTFSVVSNASYYVRAMGQGSYQCLCILPTQVDITAVPHVPPNDFYADRLSLGDSTNQTFVATTIGATTMRSSHSRVREYRGTEGAVWWEWTSLIDGRLLINVTPLSKFPYWPGVYSRAFSGRNVAALRPVIPELELLSTEDNDGYGHGSFPVRAGHTYAIALHTQLKGIFEMNVHVVQKPTNDDFDDAARVEGNSWTTMGDITGATIQRAEPRNRDARAKASVWYSWIAPESRTYVVTVSNADGILHPAIGVFTGERLAMLRNIAKGAHAGPELNVQWSATAGVVYHLAIDGNRRGKVRVALKPTDL